MSILKLLKKVLQKKNDSLIQLRLQNDTQVYAHFESDLFP